MCTSVWFGKISHFCLSGSSQINRNALCISQFLFAFNSSKKCLLTEKGVSRKSKIPVQSVIASFRLKINRDRKVVIETATRL